MLLRGFDGVGYTHHLDNVVQRFVAEAARGGVDLFRVFDCLNGVENMRVSIDAVIGSGKSCEGVPDSRAALAVWRSTCPLPRDWSRRHIQHGSRLD